VFTYVNPAIERMTGYTPDEWVGSSLADHCDDENLALMRKAVEAEIRKGPEHEGVIFEAEMLHRDGTPVVVEIHGRVIFDEDWRPVMLQGTTRDVTERRRMEGERTRLQQQLLQAQRLESVGRLAGGVAHDFNNMLQSILGNAEMALDRCGVEGELPEHLREIEGAAGHAARLTGQLLAFARRQSSRPEVLNLNESVADTLDMLRRLMGEDIDLLWKPEEDLWRVRIDPSQVDQILANLCVNARDAIQGNGKVTIETANASFDEDYCRRNPEFDPGDYVMLAVSDDGIGMDTDVMASIFEPFFTTKEKEKGTGLGLATVYGIVKQNEGFINVYSEPGEGSTFKVYLSRHAGGKAPSVKRGAGDRGITDSEGETILLVEDEPAILKVARSILEGLGYEVLTASTPEEALELAENLSTGIDLLVTDVVLPGMNGRDLAAKLREQDECLRVLYMSGYTANVIMHQGILENGVHFVQKPFSMERLALSVRKALGGPTPS
ncbi:MAG: response regulator, partial [Candidatus Fermentibacterota bacterium]